MPSVYFDVLTRYVGVVALTLQMGYHVEVVDQLSQTHRTTMLKRLVRNLAPWMLIPLLVACSASQSSTPSVPEPPKPPSEPSATSEAPTPTPAGGAESAPTTEAGGASESKESDSEAGEEGAENEGTENEIEEAGEPAGTAPGGSPPGARTSDEKRAGLDGELDEALREFDGLILKEQELLEGRREASAAAGGGGGEGSGGEELESRRSAQTAGGTGASPDAPEEPPTSESGARVESTPGGDDTQTPPVPEDIGDGRDDDIVAKQLREAAMSEKDPVLREKLWEEYRTYKGATRN